MTTPSEISFNETEASSTYTQAQGALDNHRQAIPPHDPTGIDDAAISDAVRGHNDKTRDTIDDAHQSLRKGKEAIAGLGEGDRNNAARARRIDPGGVAALRDALQRPMGAASPFPPAQPTAAVPAPSMPPISAPQMSVPAVPAGMVNLAPQALSRLIDGAGLGRLNPAAPAGVGGKDPLPTSGVVLRPTGLPTMRKSQMLAVIEQALDNNGVSTDPGVRAHWRDLLFNQGGRESSGYPDAVNKIDENAIGPIQEDGAPAQSSRGWLQVIPSTFAAHHVAGTSNNIYDPVANASAAVGYMMHDYHVGADGTGLADFHARRAASGYCGY